MNVSFVAVACPVREKLPLPYHDHHEKVQLSASIALLRSELPGNNVEACEKATCTDHQSPVNPK